MDLHKSNIDFAQTRWSLVDALRSDDPDSRKQALDSLAKVYWPAVYSFLRRGGKDQEKAGELTQAFFGTVIIQRNLFEQADSQKARLRTLILKSLNNFLIDQHRRNIVRGEGLHVTFDQAELEVLITENPHESPEDQYQKSWASAILNEALRRCESHYLAKDQPHYWQAFLQKIVFPCIRGSEAPTSSKIAEMDHFENPAAVNNAIHAVKKRLMALLKEVVTETTSGDGTAEEEYHHILKVLS